VDVALANVKLFLLGTFHGVVRSHRLQAGIDDFVYRSNHRRWEAQIPNRSLALYLGTTGPALCGKAAR
jgi:hypothetical protein